MGFFIALAAKIGILVISFVVLKLIKKYNFNKGIGLIVISISAIVVNSIGSKLGINELDDHASSTIYLIIIVIIWLYLEVKKDIDREKENPKNKSMYHCKNKSN